MHRRWYFEMCKTQSDAWLFKRAFHPVKGMTNLDAATIRLALRHRLDLPKEKIKPKPKKEKPKKTRPEDMIYKIIKTTCEVTGVKYIELLSRRREFSSERHIAMYLSVYLLGMPYTEVAKAFGRDHTTIIHAVKKIENSDDDFLVNSYLKEIATRLDEKWVEYVLG